MKDHDIMLSIRISKKALEEWDKFCELNQLSRSELIRLSVTEKISRDSDFLLQKMDELLVHYFKSLDVKIQNQLNLIYKKLEEKNR